VKYLKYEKKYSEHTVIAYSKDIDQFYQFLAIRYNLSDISLVQPLHIRTWVVAMMTDHLSNKTINRKISSLRTYYKFLKKNGHISKSPLRQVISPKIEKRLPAFVRESEMHRGLSAPKDLSSFSVFRDYLVVELLYQTGMRRSELIHLVDGDINIARKEMKVLGKGNKERIIPVSDKLIDLISKYQDMRDEEFSESPESLIVTDRGKKVYPKFIYNLVKEWIGSYSTIEKKSPHIIRHTFATHLANQGADLNAIKEFLGHASLAATQIYTHNTIDKLKGVYLKAHPRA
jgi:integrase/recombinase XerC